MATAVLEQATDLARSSRAVSPIDIERMLRADAESRTYPTRIWVCPSLCGCELEITAKQWGPSPDPPTVERALDDYATVMARLSTGRWDRHPVPGTIESIKQVSVCPAHMKWRKKAVPFNPYDSHAAGYLLPPYQKYLREASRLRELAALTADADPAFAARAVVTATREQEMAESLHPKWAASLSPVERLYVHLHIYTGQRWGLACGCRIYQHGRRDQDFRTNAEHPVHTKRCSLHEDDHTHAQALKDHEMLMPLLVRA